MGQLGERPDREVMGDRADLPAPLAALIEDFASLDRAGRAELLISYADRFHEVPPEVASRPFPDSSRVTHCESQAYVLAEDLPGGTLKYHFAVENPQGLSARAWAVIMDEAFSGQQLERVAAVPGDVVFDIFGREVSMGRGAGLIGMLALVQRLARERLAARVAS